MTRRPGKEGTQVTDRPAATQHLRNLALLRRVRDRIDLQLLTGDERSRAAGLSRQALRIVGSGGSWGLPRAAGRGRRAVDGPVAGAGSAVAAAA
jgi:hypothetical protein